tara:strand:+ start:386 stop:529 length:144 start_codon:yes stop_codon:yes gene_type:complete
MARTDLGSEPPLLERREGKISPKATPGMECVQAAGADPDRGQALVVS